MDVVITNALIVDSITGIIKADVGIKGNRIVGIGKAGNPDMMDGVDSNMIVGATTDVIAGEKLILTAGGIDTHVHWIWYVRSTKGNKENCLLWGEGRSRKTKPKPKPLVDGVEGKKQLFHGGLVCCSI